MAGLKKSITDHKTLENKKRNKNYCKETGTMSDKKSVFVTATNKWRNENIKKKNV